MSGVVDVGDAVQLTFNTTSGSDVIRWWFDPMGTAIIDGDTVSESPSGSGKFPASFAPTASGPWRARFAASGNATAVEDYWINARDVPNEPPPLASPGDVIELFGPMTTEQQALTAALLRHASRLVRGRFPDLADRIAFAAAAQPHGRKRVDVASGEGHHPAAAKLLADHARQVTVHRPGQRGLTRRAKLHAGHGHHVGHFGQPLQLLRIEQVGPHGLDAPALQEWFEFGIAEPSHSDNSFLFPRSFEGSDCHPG